MLGIPKILWKIDSIWLKIALTMIAATSTQCSACRTSLFNIISLVCTAFVLGLVHWSIPWLRCKNQIREQYLVTPGICLHSNTSLAPVGNEKNFTWLRLDFSESVNHFLCVYTWSLSACQLCSCLTQRPVCPQKCKLVGKKMFT